jgi:hypothetical protein
MMTKKIAGFATAVAALLLLAALAYTNLEIRRETVFRPPSRRALVNDFFALEQWLIRTGHPLRFISRGDISRVLSASEKTLFIQAPAFDWEDAGEPLKNWIREGGFLVVSLELPLHEDENLETFLMSFGADAEIFDVSGAGSGADTGGITGENGEDSEYDEGLVIEPVPDFDQALQFNIAEETGEAAAVIKEAGKIIRLVRIPLGSGFLTLIGRPRFMQNDYLEREVNARLAWDLTGGPAGGDNPGILFIRGKRQVKSLFGKVADRGNFLPLGLSLLILIIVGFWMVIPAFGLLFQEKALSGRPIGERFLAEIRFLKKYRALETYLEVYIREIKRKLRGRETEAELEIIEKTLKTKGHLPYKDLVRALQKLEIMMERL